MQLLRRTNLLRNAFCSTSALRPNLPFRNGGTLCVPREDIVKYVKLQTEEGKKCKNDGVKLIPEVAAFKEAVLTDPILKMCYIGGLDSIPSKGCLHRDHPEQLFDTINSICINAPKFHDAKITGVPFYILFTDFLDTRYGQAFFGNPIVNMHLKNIFGAYSTMLQSKVSLKYLVENSKYGWLSPKAQTFVDWDDYYVDKSKPHWGFKSWHDWFTRPIRPEARPIDERKNVIVHSSDSYPLIYPGNDLLEGRNPAHGVLTDNKFWLKDNRYSLYDMFGAKEMGIKDLIDKHFMGGTVYQAFLDPWCYHRWHSPISGTIIKSYKLGGTYYLSNPGLPLKIPEHDNYVASQPFLSVVSVRQIYIIELDDGSGRKVAVIEIGMVEVSSCNSTVIQGQKVKKGDQLGYFAFGGSSYAMVFDRDFDLTFDECMFKPNSSGDSNKVFVNSQLCSFKE